MKGKRRVGIKSWRPAQCPTSHSPKLSHRREKINTIVTLRSSFLFSFCVRHSCPPPSECTQVSAASIKTVSKGVLCSVVPGGPIPACIMNPLHQERASSSPTWGRSMPLMPSPLSCFLSNTPETHSVSDSAAARPPPILHHRGRSQRSRS